MNGDVIEGMAVKAQTSPTMNVNVAAGSARIGTGSYPTSYGYFVAIDTTTGSPAGEVVAITTASSSNPRIDTIVAYVDTTVTPSSGTANNPNNMLKVAAVAGTPAASPSAPSNTAIQSAIGASNPFIKLANVLVGTSVTQITTGNITDLRTMAGIDPAQSSLSAWQAYTPTITLNGGTSNGNAVIAGSYKQIGKTVHFAIKYTIGTTTNFTGLTAIYASLPIAASATFADTASASWATGVAVISGIFYPLIGAAVDSTHINVSAQNVAGTYIFATGITPTIPAAWNIGHTFFVAGTYEAA